MRAKMLKVERSNELPSYIGVHGCAQCGSRFRARTAVQRFCSLKCFGDYHSKARIKRRISEGMQKVRAAKTDKRVLSGQEA